MLAATKAATEETASTSKATKASVAEEAAIAVDAENQVLLLNHTHH